jgi:hypothetical protein
MPLILPGNVASAIGGYEVANSCRFNDDDAAYMSRSESSGTSNQKATFSVWTKRGHISDDCYFYDHHTDTSNNQRFYFAADNRLQLYIISGGSAVANVITTRLFRDPSAWMHICVALDSTQSTASDRVKFYINGTRVTAFDTATYPSLNADLKMNASGVTHYIGTYGGATSSYTYDGYIAEAVYLDGTQNAVTDFGEFDEDSPTIWKPKDVSGLTFGTNGFYLDFEDSGDLGDDESGNGNDFAETNLAATDQATDTPTNNFATLNPLDINPASAGDVFSEGNLSLTTNNINNAAGSRSTMAVTAGKWYCECKWVHTQDWNGVMATDTTITGGMTTGTITWYQGRTLYVDGSNIESWGSAVADGVICGLALDMDNGRVTISQAGQWYDTDTFDAASPTTYANLTSGYDTWSFLSRSGSGNRTSEWNFGNPIHSITSGNADANGYGNFEYAVPSGFYALCTKNLAEYG